MYHFFLPPGQEAEDSFRISGPDVKHIGRVLRLGKGDRIIISNNQDRRYLCEIQEIGSDFVRVRKTEEPLPSTEMNRRVILFQGLPKSDKMDYIVEKSVELGVAGIVPVEMERSVVKLEANKKETCRSRWQAKAESAAKQSGRERIPEVEAVASFSEAVKMAANLDGILVPYESAEGMEQTRNLIASVPKGACLGVFIGPEGGFSRKEIESLEEAGGRVITLGPRILRTETAGAAFLAMCTLLWEES
ncbi:MAG: 16S rRNA (uracil(1498)-N(3))-methyltransferase [Lachnospiraceae bacterium]|nr:16S rRNA (uracil(1498)-N(3))-methyltransferase [Lachnospiraceae bacterium]